MLFFCLSGLLMAELYIRQDATWASVWNFIRARFARIFPLFAVVVVGSALIYHYDTGFPFHLDAVAATKHLLLLGDGLTMWSISVEFQFYAAFVGLWLLYAALPKRHQKWAVLSGRGSAAIILWQASAATGLGRAASFVLPLLLALDVLASVIPGPSAHDCYRSHPSLHLTVGFMSTRPSKKWPS
jgi:peptidoglycan/LPS O-acetylase OafA/YrhL